MNTKIVGIVTFVIGVASGVGCTYKYFKNKYEGYANEEIESVKDMARRQIEAMREPKISSEKLSREYDGDPVQLIDVNGKAILTDNEKAKDGTYGYNDGDVCIKKSTPPAEDTRTHAQKAADLNRKAKAKKDKEDSIARRTKSKDAVAYNKIASSYKRKIDIKSSLDEDTDVNEEDIDEDQKNQELEDQINEEAEDQKADDEQDSYDRLMSMQTSSNRSPQDPFIISPEQFVRECKSYDKVTLTYYNKDDVLLDEDKEPIDDRTPVVGLSALESFGTMSDDPNLVYVRNERYDIDYEIIREDASYSADVLGWDK